MTRGQRRLQFAAMKHPALRLLLLPLAAFACLAQVRFVQLEASWTNRVATYQAATNEIVRLQSVQRFGTFDDVEVRAPYGADWIYFAPGEEWLGALTWELYAAPASVPHNSRARVTCILRVETVNTVGTDPAQVAVVPRGEPARVELQTSADLREWSALAVTNLPPEASNRFLRVRVLAPAE
jgi:hypothetical protein